MTTLRLSAGRERRQRQTEPCCRNSHGEPLYRGHPGHVLNERTGRERRVASYRALLNRNMREAQDAGWREPYGTLGDLILALRSRDEVVVRPAREADADATESGK